MFKLFFNFNFYYIIALNLRDWTITGLNVLIDEKNQMNLKTLKNHQNNLFLIFFIKILSVVCCRLSFCICYKSS